VQSGVPGVPIDEAFEQIRAELNLPKANAE
jgi:hypothetical protein